MILIKIKKFQENCLFYKKKKQLNYIFNKYKNINKKKIKMIYIIFINLIKF